MSAAPATDAIRFEKTSKRYGAVKALDAVSIDIARGEMFGVIGPDGAGKTTAIRLACGLLKPDEGRISVLGRDPVREHRAVTTAIGYLSQRFSLYGDLTIDENIAFFAEIHGVGRYQEARNRLLEMTQLTPFRARRADRLSGGMKQKLALACTLVHEPQVLLLDEPTTGVDPVSRREFWKLLSEFLGQGLTIVMTTPYLDEAERCARVALLHEGKLLAIDRPVTLQAALSGQLIEVITEHRDRRSTCWRLFPASTMYRRSAIARTCGSRAARRSRGSPTSTSTLRAQGIHVISARPVPATLEDVFIALITRKTDDAGSPVSPVMVGKSS